MAFNIKNLSVVAYVNGYTSWHYRPASEETVSDILELGYFNAAFDLLSIGDTIKITTDENHKSFTFFIDAFVSRKKEKEKSIKLYIINIVELER